MAKRAIGGRWTEEQARMVLDAWEESGESGTRYARSIGVVPQRLFWWRRRLEESVAQITAKSTLVPVTVRGASALGSAGSASVVVTTRSGVRIEVNEVEAATAAWVLAVLSGEDQS